MAIIGPQPVVFASFDCISDNEFFCCSLVRLLVHTLLYYYLYYNN